MIYSEWTYAQFRAATGLPPLAYEEWLALPSEVDRKDVIEIYGNPDEMDMIRAVLNSGQPPMEG